MKKNNLVVKSNILNQVTCYTSTTQLKMFSKIILEIRRNRNQEFYKFLISDLIDEFNFGKEHYLYLKNICKKMGGMIDIPQKQGFCLEALFYKINTEEKGFISFKVNPDLKDYILDQTKNFTSYFLENVAHLKSAYSFRIYELLKQYQSKTSLDGWYKIELKTLKEKLNIDEKQYSLYSNFKIKVIKQAQKELKAKTDLYFDFEEIKRGRKVDIIVFHIKPNKKIIEELKKRKIKDESLFSSYQAPLEQEVKAREQEGIQNKDINQETQQTIKQELKEQPQEPIKTEPPHNLKNTDIYKFLVRTFKLDDPFIQELFTLYDKKRLKRNFIYVAKKLTNNEIKESIGGFLRKALEGDYANQKTITQIQDENREEQKQKELKQDQDQQIISNLKKLYNKHNQEKLYKYLVKNKLDLKQEFNNFTQDKKPLNIFTKETQETINQDYSQAIKDITKKSDNTFFKLYLYKHIKLKSFEAFSKKQGYTIKKSKDHLGQEHYNIIQENQSKETNIFK